MDKRLKQVHFLIKLIFVADFKSKRAAYDPYAALFLIFIMCNLLANQNIKIVFFNLIYLVKPSFCIRLVL